MLFRLGNKELQYLGWNFCVRLEIGNLTGSCIRREHRVHRVLKDMAELACKLPKKRIPIRSRAAFQSVGGNIEAMNVLWHRIRILQNTGVLPQKLQVLRSFLQEDLDEFCSGGAHKVSCAMRADLR